ncbi:MAG: hypothetical protein AAF430_04025 [Myxococcota bacterium]
MPPAVERLPLTGADAFLLAFNAETRRRNRASHLSQIVLRLGSGFDDAGFERVLADVVRANPIVTAPIRRPGLLGTGAAEYRLDLAARAPGPEFSVHRMSGPAPAPDAVSVPAQVTKRLNSLHSEKVGGLFHVDALRYDDGATDLVITWLHMLLDGWGSERFVEFLEAVYGGTSAAAVPAADAPDAPPDVALPATQRERGAMAMSWQNWMSNLGKLRVRSIAGPECGARQDLVVARSRYDASQSESITGRASQLAGFLTPMIFYLAAAIRAHHAVLEKRGTPSESYVVPLPVNLRPKGGEGGIFRTRVSLLWFQVESKLAGDLEALLQALKEQRRRAIRTHQIENGVAAMDFARFAPSRIYGSMARRALRGELCSFFFAYTGEFCPGLDRFFGAPVHDGYGVPSVPASPGSGLVFALRGGQLGATHVYQRDAWTDDDLGIFRGQLEQDLLG